MKRYWIVVAVVSALAVAGSYVAFGQQDRQGMMGGMMGQGGGMMNRGGPQQGMMGSSGGMMGMMRGMMAQSISHEAMVATSDGGVIVWAGDKLMKYDGSLNLVKEAELKVDYGAMQQRMQKMMENMPMMRGGMMGGSSGSSGDGGAKP
jgi:hypothetical protein